MAHIVENVGVGARQGIFSRLIDDVMMRVQRRRVYNRTYAELTQLSTRELDDLGISRSMISRLAYEAAYKN